MVFYPEKRETEREGEIVQGVEGGGRSKKLERDEIEWAKERMRMNDGARSRGEK